MSSVQLKVCDLNIYTRGNNACLVHGLGIELSPGESLGIVGESGSGKTITLKSLIGLLPVTLYDRCGYKCINAPAAMIFQNPMRALDPLCPVGDQLMEVYMAHHSGTGPHGGGFINKLHGIIWPDRVLRERAEQWCTDILKRLELPEELIYGKRLPRELSGGQCQRVCIALALACEPGILLCDEPTTALDVTVQKHLTALLKELQEEKGFSIIFVTHNLLVASEICDRIMVMKDGEQVEEGTSAEILGAPVQAYTKRLVGSLLYV